MDPFYEKWATSGTNLSLEQYREWYCRQYLRISAEQHRRDEKFRRESEERERRYQEERLRKAQEAEEAERRRAAAQEERERNRVLYEWSYRKAEEERQRLAKIRADWPGYLARYAEREAEDLKNEAAYREIRNSSEPYASCGVMEDEEWELSADLWAALE